MTDPDRPPHPGPAAGRPDASSAAPSDDPATDPRYAWDRDPATRARRAEYWRRNLRWVAGLLVVWFVVSYGFGILLAGPLDAYRIPLTGFPVGFWFAQQGAIYVFVALIFVYVRAMNRLDREFDVDETPEGGA